MTRWQKERLAEQLKFFGAKKKRFISCYAKKPRILCKVKVKRTISKDNITEIDYIKSKSDYLDRQMEGLRRQQLGMGMQGSQHAFLQMTAAGQASQRQSQAMFLAANAGLSSGLMDMSNGADMAQARQNPYVPYIGGWCG